MMDNNDLNLIVRKANEYDFSELLGEFFTSILPPEELRKALTSLYITLSLRICYDGIGACSEMHENLSALVRLIEALEKTKPTATPRLIVCNANEMSR